MADQSIQRGLAAILAVDVVGYSSLMEDDTEGTVAASSGRRRQGHRAVAMMGLSGRGAQPR